MARYDGNYMEYEQERESEKGEECPACFGQAVEGGHCPDCDVIYHKDGRCCLCDGILTEIILCLNKECGHWEEI